MEIKISGKAAAYLKEKTTESRMARVYIKGYSWGNLTLGMALDELKKGDRTYETNGIKIIVDKKADKQIKGISVDVIDTILGKLVVVENLYKVNSGCC